MTNLNTNIIAVNDIITEINSLNDKAATIINDPASTSEQLTEANGHLKSSEMMSKMLSKRLKTFE